MIKLELFWPLKKTIITQGFGENQYAVYKAEWGLLGHNGIDMIDTTHYGNGFDVFAAHDGIVTFAGADSNEGYGVVIRTEEPFDYKDQPTYFKTIYWHLYQDKIFVKIGDRVRIGDRIALGDSTGRNTGPHLHFGLKPIKQGEADWLWDNIEQKNGYNGAIDPAPYFSTMSAYQLRTSLQTMSENLKKLAEVLANWLKGRRA